MKKSETRLAAEILCAMRGIDPAAPVTEVQVQGGTIASGQQWHAAVDEIRRFKEVQAAISKAQAPNDRSLI